MWLTYQVKRFALRRQKNAVSRSEWKKKLAKIAIVERDLRIIQQDKHNQQDALGVADRRTLNCRRFPRHKRGRWERHPTDATVGSNFFPVTSTEHPEGFSTRRNTCTIVTNWPAIIDQGCYTEITQFMIHRFFVPSFEQHNKYNGPSFEREVWLAKLAIQWRLNFF